MQATLVLEKAFKLIQEKKIDTFDVPTIEALVRGSND
jgi:hypothetical protein